MSAAQTMYCLNTEFHEETTKIAYMLQCTGWYKKTGTFEKPNKNWRNKKKLLTEIEPLQLAF